MPLVFQQQISEDSVIASAFQIANAARTAPKAKGVDNLVIAVLYGGDLEAFADKMVELSKDSPAAPIVVRDAGNLRNSQALILIGTKIKSHGLNCGLCGFGTCAHRVEHHPDAPCFFNSHDLGIAVGSAASRAADMRIDNRVMYSIGSIAARLSLLGEDVPIITAIPLTIASKSPYFDRKQG